MNPSKLFEHFDRISDAPEAIPHLRHFVRDLAVRGKLVEQDAKHLRASRQLHGEVEDAPYQVPATWNWARVGDVADCRLGKMLDRAKNRGTLRRYLRNVNVRWFDFDLSDVFEMRFLDSELDEFALRTGDVLVCENGEPGRAAVWDDREGDIYFQKAIHRVRFNDSVDSHFFVNVLRASADSGRLGGYFTGVGIQHFTGRGLASFLFAVPPLAEQLRIVAKINELMALCDRLEMVHAERERRRDRLTAASLRRLSEPTDTRAFREHATFDLQHFARLTTRHDQIEALRGAILDLAVRGRLVAQDSRDEPASELLKQIQAEKTQPLKREKTKKEPVGPLHEDLSATPVPPGWQVVRARELLTFVTIGSRGWAAHYAREGAIFLRIGNLDYGTTDLDLSDVQRVNPPKGAEGERTLVQEGDILISITGDTGMVGLVPSGLPAAYINQHIALARPSNRICKRYLAMFFTSLRALADLKRLQRGIKNSLGLEDIRSVVVFVPPLAEQHRIVAKVDELMAVCDRFEAQLTTAQTESRRLLEAVLHEALAPVG